MNKGTTGTDWSWLPLDIRATGLRNFLVSIWIFNSKNLCFTCRIAALLTPEIEIFFLIQCVPVKTGHTVNRVYLKNRNL